MSDTFYHTLPNGVQIVHRKTTSPVVYVGIMVGAGTRHEQPNENGMAHYIEHCVFKGTEHYTARQIINHIEGIGGEINAYTTKEETTFYAATLSNHFRTTLHLLADMVLHPTFSKKETDKEVTVILDEIESYNDSPSELIYDDFENMIFEGSSLAMPILGTKKTLRRISKSPDIALSWMQQHYRPERMVLFVLGNVSTQQVLSAAEKELLASSPYRPIASSPITHSEASNSPQGVQYPTIQTPHPPDAHYAGVVCLPYWSPQAADHVSLEQYPGRWQYVQPLVPQLAREAWPGVQYRLAGSAAERYGLLEYLPRV